MNSWRQPSRSMARVSARILQVIRESGAEGPKVYQHLINDKVVRGLLLIHDLHPADLETRLRDALNQVRPYLQSHGGNVELISLTGQSARLRLKAPAKVARRPRSHWSWRFEMLSKRHAQISPALRWKASPRR